VRFAAVDQLGKTAPITQASAVATAKAVSMISVTEARAQVYIPYLPAMRAANPNLKMIVYLNGAFAFSGEGTKYPDSWYARTATGAKIRSTSIGNWLMDVTSGSPWAANRSQTCQQDMTAWHYDGCFLDVLGYGGVTKFYVQPGLPVHPGTSQVWRPSEWIAATSHLAQQVQQATHGVIIANGLDDGTAFVGSPQGGPPGTRALITPGVGGDAEFFPHGHWLDNVHMLQTPNAIIMTNTKWNPSDQWHRFSLATFALGTNGLDVYFFLPLVGSNPDLPDRYQSAAAGLGAPTGAALQTSSGAWERTFAGGLAVANPGSASVTVALPRPLKNLDGNTVTSETLAPNSGDLLLG
jgi:hypothetical protein